MLYIDVTVQIPLFLVVHTVVVMIVFKVTKHLVWVFIQYSVLIDGFIRYSNFLQQMFNYQSVHNNVCDKYNFIHNSKYYTDKYCYNHDRNIIFMTARDNLWSNNILPSSYRAVENNMLDSLRLSIFNYKNSNKVNNYDDNQLNKYLSIDVLTPGLNSKLEQKAMLFQENLFDILISMMSILLLSFENIHFAFQSIGIDIVRIN